MEGQIFSQDLRKIFENTEEGGERLTIKSLRDYMAKCPPQLRRSYDFVRCLIDFLVEKLNTSDCKDPALVASVINFTFQYKDRFLKCLHYLDKILDLMFHTNPSSVPEGVVFLRIEEVLRDRRLPLLKLLIRYGAIPLPSAFSQMAFYRALSLRSMLSEFVLKKIKKDKIRWPIHENLRILYEKCSGPKCSPEENACVLRRNIVAMVIGTLYQDDGWYDHGNPEGEAVGAKCLKYYFEAIPEPFVVVREMENLIFEPQSLKDILDVALLKAKFDRYNILFPDWNVLQPRSLKHLSRCAARSHLCRQGTLPDVISKLPLPNVLKNYLLLKNVVNESD